MQNQDSDLLFTAKDSPEIDVRSIGVHDLGQAYLNFITNTDINENVENMKQKTVETLIKDLYATVRENLLDRFENSEVRTEVHSNAFYSIDRYILFDIIEMRDRLRVPSKVVQGLKCVLVIPASMGDAERSFSAANRLSSAERSKIKTKTLDNLMRIQRNGPSVLLEKPERLVKQWMQPLPGLGLSPRKSSSFTQEENLLKEIWGNLRKDILKKTAELSVRRELTLYSLQREKDTDMLRDSQLSAELSKANLFQ
ncbi:hypothetical protein Aduo_015264 [Ancylostoma duodenale]